MLLSSREKQGGEYSRWMIGDEWLVSSTNACPTRGLCRHFLLLLQKVFYQCDDTDRQSPSVRESDTRYTLETLPKLRPLATFHEGWESSWLLCAYPKATGENIS